MAGTRDIELNTGTRHKYEIRDREQAGLVMDRQFPLDPARVGRTCKMSPAQAESIRDMNTEELQKQIFVTPVEFAYLTGRTLKSVRNLMDRAQLPVHREGMPGSKRPKRFIMLQEYWEAVAHCRALVTPEERHYIDRLMHDKSTYRRTTGNNHTVLKRNSRSVLRG